MTDETSARLGLALLQPGQAQKEMTHNAALAALDIAVQASVAAAGVVAPPADPAIGACWIVGDAPTGDWAGRARAIAGWTAGGWRFVVPRAGFTAWCETDGVPMRYDGSAWSVVTLAGSRVVIGGLTVVGPRRAAIPDCAGGATVDAEARAAIASILGALRGHGLIGG